MGVDNEIEQEVGFILQQVRAKDVRFKPLDDVEFQDIASHSGEAHRGPTYAGNHQNKPITMGGTRDEDG